MSYVKSEDIKLFPSSLRRYANDINSKFTTEFNLTNMINRLVDSKNFITKYDGSTIVFTIQGYYFELQIGKYLSSFDEDTSIYATIKLSDKNLYINSSSLSSNIISQVLVTQTTDSYDTLDSNENFNGLSLSNVASSESSEFNLLLLTRNSSTDSWEIPSNSSHKYSTKSVYVTVEDNNDYSIDYLFNKPEDDKNIIPSIYANTINAKLINSVNGASNIGEQTNKFNNIYANNIYGNINFPTPIKLWGQKVESNKDGDISGDIVDTGNITPTSNATSNIGSEEKRYNNIYATNINATDIYTTNCSGIGGLDRLVEEKTTKAIQDSVFESWELSY